MKYCVTGGAGFIGSNLIDKLLDLGHKVICIDNFSTGKISNLSKAYNHTTKNFKSYSFDLVKDKAIIPDIFKGCDAIFHFAANADVRYNLDNPYKIFEQNTIATFNVLESMRLSNVKHIVFSSTGSVYGNTSIYPTSEIVALEKQTSMYSATKLASESLIQAYSEGFGFIGSIFRFVSVLGQRYSHGHVYDFYNQLELHPATLTVLGNGYQTKSYLHVDDCIEGVLLSLDNNNENITIYNLSTDETITVRDSISEIAQILELSPIINFGNNKEGWVGDNPMIYLDCSKIRKLGWIPKHTIRESIFDTLQYLKQNSRIELN